MYENEQGERADTLTQAARMLVKDNRHQHAVACLQKAVNLQPRCVVCECVCVSCRLALAYTIAY